ncbi:hypothetical protein LSCM1_00148 [Leishmania martiniquensis]|uniref:Uncharacterized protein n=1 Tax=Leishmania martiniquensis TaxID=1580590 RepID=A0A836K9L4_9TRYP|nr:hypothetical protein LSCM1_00148 [Leishmania martiniquensis]
MLSLKAGNSSVGCKPGVPALQPHRTQASVSNPAQDTRTTGVLASSQGCSTRRVEKGSLRVLDPDALSAASDNKEGGSANTSSDHAGPLSLEGRLAAVRERRLAREAQALDAAGCVARSSAATASRPVVPSQQARSTVASLSQADARPTPSPSIQPAQTLTSTIPMDFSAPEAKIAVGPFTSTLCTDDVGNKSSVPAVAATLRAPRAATYATAPTAANSYSVSCTGAWVSSPTSEQPAHAGYAAPLHRFPSTTSTGSTITFSESQTSHDSLAVPSARDSPPSHPNGPAPMEAKVGPVQTHRWQRAAAEVLSPPHHSVDDALTPSRIHSNEAGSSSYVGLLHSALDANRVTSPVSAAAQHPSPPPCMHLERIVTAAENAECCTSTTATPEAIVFPSTGEVQSDSVTEISSPSERRASSCDTDNPIGLDASFQRPTYGILPCTDTHIRPFAPFARPSATPVRGSGAPPQLLFEESWRDSTTAGVCLRRESPHTGRMYSMPCEWSHSGCFTPARSTSSREAWDGQLRSASAECGTSLGSALSVTTPIFLSRHRMTSMVAERVAPSPPRASALPSLLSSALRPVFLTTAVRSKYKLLDDSTATLSTAAAERDITDQLAMEHRLSCLKWELTRQRMRRRRDGDVATL